MLSPIADQSPGFREIFPRVSDFKNYNESDRIAFKAVEICQLKDSIFIGEGQTAFLMGQYLLKTSVHIYTNYLPLITLLISESFPHLVVMGGQYIKNQNVLVSPEGRSSYQGRYLFVCGDGITEAGVTKSALLSIIEERKMQSYADKVIAMVESDKVGIYGGMSLFELDELDMLITGKDAPADMIDLLRSKNVDVHLV